MDAQPAEGDALSAVSSSRSEEPRAAPDIEYLPRDPHEYNPGIGLIGCGNISTHHLDAYRRAGYRVVALCDRIEENARKQRATYFPEARIYSDYRELVRNDQIEVVDVLTHVADRVPIIEAALAASRHVLSQKPFVLDIDQGQRLVDLADRQGVRLAVNQNGRWAPHFAYLREAVRRGMLGELTSATLTVHWDHTWIQGTTFDAMPDVILYDFGIHWFDIVSCFFAGQRATHVFAAARRAAAQRARAPLLAHVLVQYDMAQATMAFDGTVMHGQEDRTFLAGTAGSALSRGPDLSEQRLYFYTNDGQWSPELQGTWFNDGFHGTMAELLCAIEESREPLHSARDNLHSLELAFAAIASADEGEPKVPGQVRRLPSA